MKKFSSLRKLLLIAVLAVIGLTSCSKYNYYQVYKTACPDLNVRDNGIVYEDNNCLVTYNLWSAGGNAGFLFENKSDQTIFLHLDRSFFIENGIAYDYYLNRSYGNGSVNSFSMSKGSSVTSVPIGDTPNRTSLSSFGFAKVMLLNSSASKNASSSYSKSVTYDEKPIVAIPPKSAKHISEYLITDQIYRSCDLMLFPYRKGNKSISFTSNDSPVHFSNYITYTIGENKEERHIINEFYIKEISNTSENEEVYDRKIKDCDNKTITKTYYREFSPANFYNIYRYNDFKGSEH